MAACLYRHHSLLLFRSLPLSFKMANSRTDLNKTVVDSGTVADHLTSIVAAVPQFVDRLQTDEIALLMLRTIPMQVPRATRSTAMSVVSVAVAAVRIAVVMIAMNVMNIVSAPLHRDDSLVRLAMRIAMGHQSTSIGITVCLVITSEF